MSDDAELPKPRLTSDNMQAFLDDKGIEKPCDLCGVNEWAIPVEHGGKDLTMVGLGDPGMKVYFPAYPIYCMNCGNTKLLEAGTVEQWVANNG